MKNTDKIHLANQFAQYAAMGFTWEGDITSSKSHKIFRNGEQVYNLQVYWEGISGRGYDYRCCVALYRVNAPFKNKSESPDSDKRVIPFDVFLNTQTGKIRYEEKLENQNGEI